MTQMTIAQAHTTGQTIINNVGQEIAAFIYLTNSSPTAIFTAIQQEIAQIFAFNNPTTDPQNETQELVSAAASAIVRYIKSITAEKQGQLEIMQEVFMGIQTVVMADIQN